MGDRICIATDDCIPWGGKPYKGRDIKPGQRVKVYRNLHRGGYSVVALDGPSKGLVVGHAEHITLGDVEFVVSEAGRQRVIREKKKNVHAYAVGTLLSFFCDCSIRDEYDLDPSIADYFRPIDLVRGDFIKLRYNPYRRGFFYYNFKGDDWIVSSANVASLTPSGCFVAQPHLDTTSFLGLDTTWEFMR